MKKQKYFLEKNIRPNYVSKSQKRKLFDFFYSNIQHEQMIKQKLPISVTFSSFENIIYMFLSQGIQSFPNTIIDQRNKELNILYLKLSEQVNKNINKSDLTSWFIYEFEKNIEPLICSKKT